MNGTRPEKLDSRQVILAAVPLVGRKSVSGIGAAKLYHQRIPRDLRHDRGRCDRPDGPVTLDHRGMGEPDVHRQTIDDDMVRGGLKAPQSTSHGLGGGPRDTERVDLPCPDVRDAHVERPVHDDGGELLAPGRSQALRVIQPADDAPGRQDTCRGTHGTSERPAPDLVHTRDKTIPLLTQRLLEGLELALPRVLALGQSQSTTRRAARCHNTGTHVIGEGIDGLGQRNALASGKNRSDVGYSHARLPSFIQMQ